MPYCAGLDGSAPPEDGSSQADARRRLDACEARRIQLLSLVKRTRTVSLSVQKIIHARVQLRICGESFTFRDEVRGPIRIARDARGETVFQRDRTDAPKPLFDIAKRAA